MCGNTPSLESFEGIFIRGKFVCSNCEQVISQMKACDNYYQEVKDRLKSIWFGLNEKLYFS
ncbi:MAG: sigma factor G inhibitor Gin [Bacillota bacterium]